MPKDLINLKSDAMNPPTAAMWQAMQDAQQGWVLDRQDPNVLELEAAAAALTGKEDALFLPTGRVACLVAVMTYCGRGTQIVLEQFSHIAWCQEWNFAHIAGAFPKPIPGHRGVLPPEAIVEAIVEARFGHRPKTSLVCLENTHNMAGGVCLTAEATNSACEAAHAHGVPVLLDGARLLYAAAALETPPSKLAASPDVVMFSLTKGLSAPAGAMLCGPRDAMAEAWENARRLGVASLQFAGAMAAAGLVALRTMQGCLVDDIRHARELGDRLNDIPGVRVDLDSLQTNIVMADITGLGVSAGAFLKSIYERGIWAHRLSENVLRFITHPGVNGEDIGIAVDAVAAVARDMPSKADSRA